MTNYRDILKLHSLGLNKTEIATSCKYTRNTVAATLQRAANCGLQWPLPEAMSDKQFSECLFPATASKPVYKMPDYAYVHKELQRSGVTLNLLWLEYCNQCRSAGDVIPTYVFVATLPYSGYSYVEASFSINQEAWTTAHVNAYKYFGGVTRIIQCDNLKTGVQKHGKDEVVLNKLYQELAEHYGTAILPARVRSPKDKAAPEQDVVSHSSSQYGFTRGADYYGRGNK